MRPNWIYGAHPPACNCWRCVAFRATLNTDTEITSWTCSGCGRTEWRYTGSGDLWECQNPRCRNVRRYTEARSTVGRGNNRGRPPRVGRFSGYFRIIAILIIVCVAVVATILATQSSLFEKQNIVNEISRLKSAVVGLIGELSDEKDAQILEKPKITLTKEPATPPTLNSVIGYRTYMLELINQDRKKYGLAAVELGNNVAAQTHAEELFHHGFGGHWGLEGLKPYMRYTLAGGTGWETENFAGDKTQRRPGVRYKKTPVAESLKEHQQMLMESPGHRKNILNSQHEKVNLGIACDDVACTVIQQFESNFVEFVRLPTIEKGLLRFTGATLKGIAYKDTDIYYDPLPVPLRGYEISRASCYDGGTLILTIRKPAPPRSSYLTDTVERWWPNCAEPRYLSGQSGQIPLPNRTGLVPWEDASIYVTTGNQFDIAVDISDYISQHGDGVYTLLIWGISDAGFMPLTNYSIFIESS